MHGQSVVERVSGNFRYFMVYELHWHAFSFAGVALPSRVGNSDRVAGKRVWRYPGAWPPRGGQSEPFVPPPRGVWLFRVAGGVAAPRHGREAEAS